MPLRPRRLALSLLAVALLTATAACDTGDGKELQPPTQPAPTTSVAPSATTAPLGDGVLDDGVLDTLPAEPVDPTFSLATPWGQLAPIDARYSCDGDDVSPSISWSVPPDGTVETAVVMRDLDADGLVHWLVTGIDPTFGAIPEGAMPGSARLRTNSFGVAGWSGPCPPAGEEHEYLVTVYALNRPLEAADEVPANEVVDLLERLAIAVADRSGTFAR
jgi:Raf kinase inhibitor-like YbhB/YbcL family protein